MAAIERNIVGHVSTVSPSTPIVVRLSDSHELRDGNEIIISGVVGIANANGSFCVKAIANDSRAFELFEDADFNEPITGTGKYESGGVVFASLVDDYAIVVGITRYPRLSKLDGAEADARAFYNWLISPNGGMVRSSKIRLIVSSDYPESTNPLEEKPDHDDVQRAFRWLRAKAVRLHDRRVGRRVYMFFSGHGITPGSGMVSNLDVVALLMANASPDELDAHFPGHPYAEWFRNAAAFDEIVLFMDCCRVWKDNVATFGPTPPLVSVRRDQVVRFYAAATELGSNSWQRNFGSPPERHGVFSYALLEGLSNSSGGITGEQLERFIVSRVAQLEPRQIPRIFRSIPLNSPDIVFGKAGTPLATTLQVNFGSNLIGMRVQLFGQNYPSPDSEHVITSVPWEISVTKGLYKLQLVGGGPPKLLEIDGREALTNVLFP